MDHLKFHLKNYYITQLWPYAVLMLKIIHAFMTSTLDYSNALLSGCPAGSINKLQLVQNAAGKVLARAKKHQPHFIVSTLATCHSYYGYLVYKS